MCIRDRPNHAPKMAAIPDYTFEAGETVAIQVSATDADDSLSLIHI